MNFINEYALALGWTLIHMTWITLAIAMLVQVVRLVIRSPRFNYRIGMLAIMTLPAIAVYLFEGQIDLAQRSEAAAVGLAQIINEFPQYLEVSGESGQIGTLTGWIEMHMDWIIILWFAGMISFIVRLLFGYSTLVGFRNSIQPMSNFWNKRFDTILREFNISANILFGASKHVSGPMTFGFFKPMILLPIGLVNALSVDEVEAIIRHELAHIARHDYVFKMVQSAVESLFYYTPGTWWLSKMIDIDREQCCDDYAIRSGSSEAAYIKALYKVNTFNTLESQLALGFGKEKNQLLNRVKRILKQPQEKANIMGRLIIPLVLLIVVAGISINATFKDKGDHSLEDQVEFPLELEQDLATAKAIPVPSTVIAQDTTKKKSKSVVRSTVSGNGKSYSVTKENGKITEMKVDGKKVDPRDYDKYEREMRRNSETDGFSFNYDNELTEKQQRELEERMAEFAQKMEKFEDSFEGEFSEKMEHFGKSMEEWGEQFEKDGRWKEFEERMEEWGEDFGKSFGEDFGQGMEEWGEKFGRQFSEGFSFDFDTEAIEEWGEQVEKKIEEYRMKYPEKFYQDSDGEWHLKEDNLSFEESEEIFGEGWTELADNVAKMMEGFKFNFDSEDFEFDMPDFPTPPMPPYPGSKLYEGYDGAQPYKLEMKALKSALKADGFFKDSEEVSFEMDDTSLKINGKKQSKSVFKKYEKIIKENWGEKYLEEYDIDFNIIDKDSAKKKAKGTYRI